MLVHALDTIQNFRLSCAETLLPAAARDALDFITPQIAIGSLRDASNPALLALYGFRAILNVGLVAAPRLSPPTAVIEIEHWPLKAGVRPKLEYFSDIVARLGEMRRECPPVLVHCQVGEDRGPAVVAGLLVAEAGLSPQEALQTIAARHYLDISVQLLEVLDAFAECRHGGGRTERKEP